MALPLRAGGARKLSPQDHECRVWLGACWGQGLNVWPGTRSRTGTASLRLLLPNPPNSSWRLSAIAGGIPFPQSSVNHADLPESPAGEPGGGAAPTEAPGGSRESGGLVPAVPNPRPHLGEGVILPGCFRLQEAQGLVAEAAAVQEEEGGAFAEAGQAPREADELLPWEGLFDE